MAHSNPQEKQRLYFAYGSNLSTTQMQHRCPYSKPIGLAHLTGWTWIINERGYANIVRNGHQESLGRQSAKDQLEVNNTNSLSSKQPSNMDAAAPGVYGLIYQLDVDDEKSLDRYEGVGYAYEREMLKVVWAGSNTDQSSSSGATGAPLQAEPLQPAVGTEDRVHLETKAQMLGETFEALVYVDYERTTPSVPKDEYVGRMNVGIKEASEQWGLPCAYVDQVMRPFIPTPNTANVTAAVGE